MRGGGLLRVLFSKELDVKTTDRNPSGETKLIAAIIVAASPAWATAMRLWNTGAPLAFASPSERAKARVDRKIDSGAWIRS